MMRKRSAYFLVITLASVLSATVSSIALGAIGPTQFIVKLKTGPINQDGTFNPLLAPSTLQTPVTDLDFSRRLNGIGASVYSAEETLTQNEQSLILTALRSNPDVEYAELDVLVQNQAVPNDPLYSQQWHYKSSTGGIFLPEAWDITTGSSSVYVAVIDGGYLPHPDLADRLVGGYDMITNVAQANDGDARDSNPTDAGDSVTANECGNGNAAANSSWHGVHVGGTIGASSNNGVGVAGIDWKAKMVHVRTQGKCGGQMSDIIDAITYSAGLSVAGVPTNPYPVKVMNLSLGGQVTCSTSLQSAINAAVAAGSVVVAAAGNANANLDTTDYAPAECANVLNVAATGPTGGRAPYSNYGASVSLAAPGGDTSSSTSNGVYSTLDSGTTSAASSTYSFYQGTSMAAPHVSGVLSLMFAVNPTMTPAQAMAWIKETTTPHTTGTGNDCTTATCGTGLLNAKAAVERARGVSPGVIVSASTESGGGCITQAFAGDKHARGGSSPFEFSPLFWILIFGALRALFRSRRLRRAGSPLMLAIGLVWLSSESAQAQDVGRSSSGSAWGLSTDFGFRLGIEQRKFTAQSLNQFSQPNNSTGLWSQVSAHQPFVDGKDVVLDIFALKLYGVPLGLYGRYGLPTTKSLTARLNATGTVHTFETKFSNKMAGLVVSEKLHILPFLYMVGSFRFGLGNLNVSQTISTKTNSSVLEASAFGSELEAEVGLGTGSLLPIGSLQVYGGYARQRAVAFSATSVSGTSYSGITPGKRLLVGGGEFRVNRSGAVVGVRYVFTI